MKEDSGSEGIGRRPRPLGYEAVGFISAAEAPEHSGSILNIH